MTLSPMILSKSDDAAGAIAPGLVGSRTGPVSATSDEFGLAVLRGLAAGDYYMRVAHDSYVADPITTVNLVRVPCNQVRVVLSEPLIACWQYEGEAPVDTWTFAKGRALSKLPEKALEISRRWPKSRAVAYLAAAEPDNEIEVVALLPSVGFHKHAVDLVAITSLTMPQTVPLGKPEQSRCGWVSFTCGSLPVDGDSLMLKVTIADEKLQLVMQGTRLSDRQWSVSGKLGVPMALPIGRYRVTDAAGWIAAKTVEVAEGRERQEVALSAKADVAYLSIGVLSSDTCPVSGVLTIVTTGSERTGSTAITLPAGARWEVPVGVSSIDVAFRALGLGCKSRRVVVRAEDLGKWVRVDLETWELTR